MEVSKFLAMLLTSATLNAVKSFEDGKSTRGHVMLCEEAEKVRGVLPLSHLVSTVYCFVYTHLYFGLLKV